MHIEHFENFCSIKINQKYMNKMKPAHVKYSDAEKMVFPNAITLKILISGLQTNGTLAIFEDRVEPGVGPG